ncbi:hypothetical protein BDY21DRAFT_367967 [Lineolata rhizophorae]|uniref:Uncharacterized protein n=1 Tax=Lineolata rhizophorae TaxID=578093 RepID=A0A6A6PCU5_9PEZI|nr:hypothetical protein BDY21DRAFT_367967 [Lineolata rhizophorae]
MSCYNKVREFLNMWNEAQKQTGQYESARGFGAMLALLRMRGLDNQMSMGRMLVSIDQDLLEPWSGWPRSDTSQMIPHSPSAPYSIYGIEYVLTTTWQMKAPVPFSDINKPNRTQSSEKCRYKCNVVLNAVFWLDDYFHVDEWEPWVYGAATKPETRQHLGWLLEYADGLCPLSLLAQDHLADYPQIARVEMLWAWFEQHPHRTVKTLFELSAAGLSNVDLENDPQGVWGETSDRIRKIASELQRLHA